MTELQQINVDEVAAGDNDRQSFDAEAITRLAATIAANGLAQPITVRPADGGYRIVAGERRYRAVRELGWATVPAFVRDLTADAAAAIMLVENTCRVDLDPVEEGAAYRRRIDAGMTAAAVADAAGVSVVRVRFRVKLTELVAEARAMVASGALPLGYANLLHGLDANRQRIAMAAMGRSDLTHGAFKALTGKLADEQAAEAQAGAFDVDAFMVAEAAAAEGREAAKASRSELVEIIRELAAEVGEGSPARARAIAAINV